jgi:hypothetical protein
MSQFEIVVGTINSTAKDLEIQLQRQEMLSQHYPMHTTAKRIPMATFPSAPDLTRQRDSTSSIASSFKMNNPPPPFTRGSTSPPGISLSVGPPLPPRSRSGSRDSRASISKSELAAREAALLPSAPPDTSPDIDASAPPLHETERVPSTPVIKVSSNALRIDIPRANSLSTDDERHLASLQSRVSAPTPTFHTRSPGRLRRRPVSREVAEASAPPLEDDNASVSDRISVVSALPLYTE